MHLRRLVCFLTFLAFLVGVLISTTSGALAAATGSVSGSVVSANNGSPVQGAKVDLVGGGGAFTTSSAKDGSFSFTGLQAATYVVRVAAKLYQSTESVPLPLADGQTISLVVVLQPVTTTNIGSLGHITVKGQAVLNTSSAPTVTITNSNFVKQGAIQIQSALENLPGVTLERYDGGAPGNVTTLTIRGAGGFGGGGQGASNTGYEILVLQDGEPLRNGQYGDFDVSALTPAIYSRVEVIEGLGGTSLFGANTIGGTVNLVTRDPAKTEGGEFLLSAGGYGTTDWNVSETNTIGRFGYLIDLHRFGTDGYVPSTFEAFFHPGSTTGAGCCVSHISQGMNLKSALGKLQYNFSDSSYLVLGATLESDYRDQTGLLASPNYTSTGAPIVDKSTGLPSFFGFPGDYVWNIQPKYSADFHTALGGGSLIVRAYSQYLERVVDGYNEAVTLPCCFLSRQTDHLTGQLASWTKDFGNNDVTIGIGGNGDNFYFGQNPTSSTFPFNGLVVPFSGLHQTAQGTQLERTYLLRDDYAASAKLDLVLAGYYSTYDTLRVKRFDPRLAAVFKPDTQNVIRLSVGTGFAPPRLSDLYSPLDLSSLDNFNGPNCSFCVASSGNPNLKAETAFGEDLGWQHLLGQQGDVGVDLYHTYLSDHIFNGLFKAPPGLMFTGPFPGPVTWISKPINLAGTIYQGVEFSSEVPVTNDFGVHLLYNIQGAYPVGVDSLTVQQLGNVVNNQQYLGVPLHKYGWSIDYHTSATTTAFIGANYYAKNNAYNLDPFWIYNAGANIPVGDNNLNIAWTNIFNTNAGLFNTFNLGIPLIGGPGYNNGCFQPCNPALFLTTGYPYPPHMITVTFDHRWGSLR